MFLLAEPFLFTRAPDSQLDGITLTDAFTLSRDDLVKRITDMLQRSQKVVVVSPPASGKTSLAILLLRFLRFAYPAARLFFLSGLLYNEGMRSPHSGMAWLAAQLGLKAPVDLSTFFGDSRQKFFFIFDDAQRLYGSGVFEYMLKTSACVLAFASYGTQVVYPDTPSFQAKLSFADIRLTDLEQRELVNRFRQVYPNYDWLSVVGDIVIRDTQGHIGFLRGLLAELLQQFFKVPINSNDDLAKIFQFYLGAAMGSGAVVRGCTANEFLSAEAVTLLQRVYLGERIPTPGPRLPDSKVDEQMAVIYQQLRAVVLIDNQGYLDFATPIHRRFFLRMIFPSSTTALPFSDPDRWLLQVISCFDPRRLRDPQSAGANGFIKEGPLQHQFWQAASMCLPPKHRVAAEVSRSFAGDVEIPGELDFWIDSDLKWAFELLVCGDRKGQHLERFKLGQSYSLLCPSAARVVDFRLQSSRRVATQDDHYVAVRFADDFTTAEVIFPTWTKVIPIRGRFEQLIL